MPLFRLISICKQQLSTPVLPYKSCWAAQGKPRSGASTSTTKTRASFPELSKALLQHFSLWSVTSSALASPAKAHRRASRSQILTAQFSAQPLPYPSLPAFKPQAINSSFCSYLASSSFVSPSDRCSQRSCYFPEAKHQLPITTVRFFSSLLPYLTSPATAPSCNHSSPPGVAQG